MCGIAGLGVQRRIWVEEIDVQFSDGVPRGQR
jgi:hypothetical protein